MSTNKTPHYGLHLWEPEDKFMRTEFNENNEKLDAAMKEAKTAASQAVSQVASTKCEMRCGTYIGDGTLGRYINVGFAPKVVILEQEGGQRVNHSVYGGMALVGHPMTIHQYAAVTVSGNGFIVSSGSTYSTANEVNRRYHYVAFR